MLFDACLVDSIEGTNLAELVFIVWFPRLGGEPSRAQISQYGIQIYVTVIVQFKADKISTPSIVIWFATRLVCPIHEITICESRINSIRKSAIRGMIR